MEPKKYAASDVHRYRGLLFQSGLMCSLAIVILAFQWKARKTTDTTGYTPAYDHEPLYVVRSTTQAAERRPPGAPRPVSSSAQVTEADPGEIALPAPDATSDPVEPIAVDLPPEEPVGEIFDWTDEMPRPEGGYEAFYKLLKEEMRYPGKAQRAETEGRVFVRFTVDKDGTLRDLSVVKGIGNGCDEEALRVIRLTRWRPGRRHGRPVAVRMIQPILFKLNVR